MRMWSRGLGKENLGLCFSDADIKSVDEALAEMPEGAKDRLLASVNGRKKYSVTVTGRISPPVGWDYVILLERKDIFTLLWKMISNRKTLNLFFLMFIGIVLSH